jgi:hypothetical protein
MFYNKNQQTHNIFEEFEDDLLRLHTLHYNSWNYLLGQLTICHQTGIVTQMLRI